MSPRIARLAANGVLLAAAICPVVTQQAPPAARRDHCTLAPLTFAAGGMELPKDGAAASRAERGTDDIRTFSYSAASRIDTLSLRSSGSTTR
jgi:hypothetical protein